MTLDVHHSSSADVHPLGEGLGARRCRQRASERDKSQRFHDDVFHGCSPFAFDSPARRPAISKITPSHFLLGEAQKVLMQINCEAVDPDGSVAVPLSANGVKNGSDSASSARPFPPQRTNPLCGRGLAARSGDYVCRSNYLNERK